LIRDSKQNHLGLAQPVLALSDSGFDQLKEFFTHEDIPSVTRIEDVIVERRSNGSTAMYSQEHDAHLCYSQDETLAFQLGIAGGEFELTASLA